MKVVIIGAGHAGVQVAASLRDAQFEGEIVLISHETDMPYQKPPLSKGYLQGKQSAEVILFRSVSFYENNQIELKLGLNIVKINPLEKKIESDDGQVIDYDYLILATGAINRKLPAKGAESTEILYLRTLADAKIIEQKLEISENIAIIGGGFIGLELAALAQEKGKKVSVIEAQSRLMERVLPKVISDVFQKTHEQNGVDIYLNTNILAVSNKGIETEKGFIEADLILAGIGVLPESQLASEAGINCDNGILVNEFQQTSDPNIYAIGDCANHFNAFAQKNLRLESVQNAVDQAKVAANHIVGKPEPYNAVPWFWTNQYQLKLQMAGISQGFDRFITRGEIGSEKFSVYYFKNDKLIGVDSLNKAADHLNARKLLAAHITPIDEQIQNLDFNLNELFNALN
jgi:3-phenylpropionate/trans-cinnamate dioxygenase ferredoxin reductase component